MQYKAYDSGHILLLIMDYADLKKNTMSTVVVVDSSALRVNTSIQHYMSKLVGNNHYNDIIITILKYGTFIFHY